MKYAVLNSEAITKLVELARTPVPEKTENEPSAWSLHFGGIEEGKRELAQEILTAMGLGW